MAPVLGTVQEFIDISLGIVSLMIIWYIIKFFIVAPPTEAEKKTKEEEWAEKGAKGREWVKKKLTERREKEERNKRKDLASPVKDHVLKASKAISEVQNHLSQLKPDKASKAVGEAQRHVKKAIRRSHELLANVEGEEREAVENVVNYLHSLQKDLLKKVNIPKKVKKGRINKILDEFEKLKGSLGNVFEHLEKFHK